MIEAWTEWEGHVINGDFRLQKFLGGSSQSGVFLAEGRGPKQKPTTIKLISASEAEFGLYLSRWGRAEGLSHPHLIRLMDKGRCRLGSQELLFVAMEYAEENLAEILPERALTPAEARDLLGPTLEALTYLHGRGSVHGHLKPANVLATANQLKLSSDGLSVPGTGERAEESKDSTTSAKIDAHDPPEKAAGELSPAADVWSLGITLAEALTQRVPAGRQGKEAGDPVVPENLPGPFFDIVSGCLRRDPQQRLTLAEIAERLRAVPAPPQPPLPPQRAKTARVGDPGWAAPQSEPQSQSVTKAQQASPARSLIGPAIIAALTVTLLFGSLGLLRHQPEARPSRTVAKSATQSSEAKPVEHSPPSGAQKTSGQQPSPGGSPVAASRTKPSPVRGRYESAAIVTNVASQSPTTTIDRSAERGDVLREVLPDVPQTARDTIQGTIRVGIKVEVDSFGNVVGTEVDSPGPSRYFARLANQAAQSWKFAHAGPEVSRQFIVRFDFRNTETRASAARTP